MIKVNPSISAEEWLIQKISDESGISAAAITHTTRFDSLFLDSLSLISVLYDMEGEFGLEELNPGIFSQFETVGELASWIQEQQG